MPKKKESIDKRIEYSIFGKKEKKKIEKPIKEKEEKQKEIVNRKEKTIRYIAISFIAIGLIVVIVFLSLFYTGYFDELARVRRSKDNKKSSEESGFVNYSFNSSNMPVGYYADIDFEVKSKKYSVTAYLFYDYAKITVQNFMNYAKKGIYNGTVIYNGSKIKDEDTNKTKGFLYGGSYISNSENKYTRVIPKSYTGKIVGEFKNNTTGDYAYNKLSHTAGVLSMTRETSDYNSADLDFFFCAYDDTSLDGNYAAFGKITTSEGISTLKQILDLYMEGNKVVIKTIGIRTVS